MRMMRSLFSLRRNATDIKASTRNINRVYRGADVGSAVTSIFLSLAVHKQQKKQLK